ncbi:hypothetical protein ACFT7S_11615 [Streptomyces sp. NPDC057136]|uniref:hypothetical protein n=1 Tax=Streptomyces sp. NPDC057136 TaxID=3346029 RepID=UPI003634FA01
MEIVTYPSRFVLQRHVGLVAYHVQRVGQVLFQSGEQRIEVPGVSLQEGKPVLVGSPTELPRHSGR